MGRILGRFRHDVEDITLQSHIRFSSTACDKEGFEVKQRSGDTS